MANNHLEQLIAEWYEYAGYFVRRNVQVAKRDQGGYDGELDVVAFHPIEKKLVHIEASLDAHSWTKREQRFKKKFDAGRTHIPQLFDGLEIPKQIDQVALLVYASTANRNSLGGGRLMHISDFFKDLVDSLKGQRVDSGVVPEQFPLIRTVQFLSEYRDSIWPDAEGGQ